MAWTVGRSQRSIEKAMVMGNARVAVNGPEDFSYSCEIRHTVNPGCPPSQGRFLATDLSIHWRDELWEPTAAPFIASRNDSHPPDDFGHNPALRNQP